MDELKLLLQKLLADGVLLAFSGGVDSALLLALASHLPGRLQAVTFATSLQVECETQEAAQLARHYQVPWEKLQLDIFQLQPELKFNPRERCYRCKKTLFTALKERAKQLGLRYVVDGTNADDLHVFRPGRRALQELQVRSPLAELGITKSQVRALAQELNLTVAHRPAAPCLATRLPYGAELNLDLIRRIASGEAFLKSLGLTTVRLRVHDQVVRLEVPPPDFPVVLHQRQKIIEHLKALGFNYLTLDLAGFRSGSMDE